MSILKKIVKGAAIVLGGPTGALTVFQINHGAETLEGTIDVAKQIVKIGTDIYRETPAAAFALESTPIHMLLKHVAEDELIFVGNVAGKLAIFTSLAWPAEGPNRAALDILRGAVPDFVTSGLLDGKLHHRLLNDQEFEMAQYIFGDTLPDRTRIVLTNLGNPVQGGAPIVIPGLDGTLYVNMGDKYVHNGTILDGPALFHELTHVWQHSRDVLSAIFVYRALGTHIDAILEERNAYLFEPGKQWVRYNIEQQASIVEAWTLGATRLFATSSGVRQFDADTVPRPVPPQRARGELTIQGPLFRYINGNIRRADTSARTRNGRSARQLLKEGGHPTMRQMHPFPPKLWW